MYTCIQVGDNRQVLKCGPGSLRALRRPDLIALYSRREVLHCGCTIAQPMHHLVCGPDQLV